MKSLCKEYLLAHSIEEVIATLSAAHDSARIISGGSDLLLEIQQGIHPPVGTLVDVTEVEEMCALEICGGFLFIGASVTLSRITHSHLTNLHAQALTDATVLMANPQVCNVATLGGNVAHALPAADGTIALLALDALAEIASITGVHKILFRDLFLGPGKTALKQGEELLVGFYLPILKIHQASCFKRIMRPQGVALPILNCAVWLERTEDIIKDIRVAIGPGGPTPFRATQTEAVLRGLPFTNSNVEMAAETIILEAHFRTSTRRASQEYRMHLASRLFMDTTLSAWERAK